MSPGHEKFVNADTIDLDWKSFEKFIDANIGSDQVGVLIARKGEGRDIVRHIFLYLSHISFEKVREWTDVYAYSQPVKTVKANNRDGILSRKIRFIPCSKRDVGTITRDEKEKYKYQITLGFIIAWTSQFAETAGRIMIIRIITLNHS